MEDRDFVDLLYQEYTKTTGAEDTYWMSEEDEGYWATGPGTWNIWAVDSNHSKSPVAQGLSEADADFITAIHGCLPDLTRRLHSALDEADRLDEAADSRENEIADLAVELKAANDRIGELETTNEGLQQVIREMEYELEEVGR